MEVISIYNNYLPKSQEQREELMRIIKEKGFQTGKKGKYLFVIGGDGTFLKAVHNNAVDNPIFIGINAGNLGFFSEFNFFDIEGIFEIIKRENYWLQEIPIYEAQVKTMDGTKSFKFINDFVVERKTSRIIHSSIHINDEKLSLFSGDGIVVSSAIGSTGYALNAGGAISYDCDNILQINGVSPVNTKAYQSLSNPVMLKDDNVITIYPSVKKQRPYRVVIDGSEIKMNDVKFIEIKKTGKVVKVLRSKRYNPTTNLRQKVIESNLFLD